MGKDIRVSDMKRYVSLAVLTGVLSACGGGGGGNSSGGGLVGGGGNTDLLYTWQAGRYYDASFYKNICENPRTGLDEFNNNEPFPDQAGTYIDENFYLRSWTHETYLWYDEVTDIDPYQYTTAEYFSLLKTNATTNTGTAKDNFHFSADTQEYRTSSVGGITFGYGMEIAVLRGGAEGDQPRDVRVIDTIPGSPADSAGVKRGMRVITVNGADVEFGNDVDTINAGLFPSTEGTSTAFTFKNDANDTTLDASLTSASISDTPVKYVDRIATETGEVGYIYFSDHNFPSEGALIDAFTELQGVDDLVLDLRYNGGGLLNVAAEVGYMIGGSNVIDQKFYELRFNDQHPTRDPITGNTIVPLLFQDYAYGYSDGVTFGDTLPTLNLSRVYILTTGSTCSASEAIINGLRGVGIEVNIFGSSTCGKPYGFYPQDNCGTTYFSIQFTGVNATGFGAYPDGFSPEDESGAVGVSVPGCYMQDDFTRELGDPEENVLEAALQFREDGTCPTSLTNPFAQKPTVFSGGESVVELPDARPYRNNMILNF